MSSLPQSSPENCPPDICPSTISERSRALAAKLSGHMGIEGALQISAENQWHGVVAALKEMQHRRKHRT